MLAARYWDTVSSAVPAIDTVTPRRCAATQPGQHALGKSHPGGGGDVVHSER